MKVTIAVSPESAAAPWWSAARQSKRVPRELRPILTSKATTIEVPAPRARALRAWCATLPGWDVEPAPLTFVGLVGRPPSARRGAGAIQLSVRLSAEEAAAIEAVATARNQTLTDALRTCALVEARRIAARAAAAADRSATSR